MLRTYVSIAIVGVMSVAPTFAQQTEPPQVPPPAVPQSSEQSVAHVAPVSDAASALAPAPTQAADPVRTLLDKLTDSEWTAQQSELVTPAASLPYPPRQTPQLLQEFRCSSIIFKRFVRTQRAVNVFVYNFPDARTAYAAYASMRTGSSNIVVRGNASSEDDDSISIWKGSRFITIHTTAEEDELSKRLASKIADRLGADIDEDGALPRQLLELPVLDKMRGSERIFFGPLAARKFMPVPFINTLQLGTSNGALFADYQFPHPDADRVKLMIVEYDGPQRAGDIYTDYARKVAVANKSKALSPSSQLSKVGQTYLLSMHRGSKLIIIGGARKKISPMILARQLAY